MILVYYTIILFNLLLCIKLIDIEYKRKSPFVLMWVALVVLFFIPSLFDYNVGLVQITEHTVSYYLDKETLFFSQFYAFGCMAFYLILIFLFSGYKRRIYKIIDYSDCGSHTWVFFVMLLISLVSVLIIYRTGVYNDFTSYREGTEFYVKVGYIYTQITFAGMSIYFMYKKKYLWLSVLSAYIVITYVTIGGSRQALILLFVVLYLGNIYINNRSILYIYIIISVSSILLYAMKVLLYVRYTSGGFSERLSAILDPDLQRIDTYSSESGLRFAYYYFIQNADAFDTFHSFRYFIRTLLAWLPSDLSFELKPSDFEYDMFSAYIESDVEGTMHPLFFGVIFSDVGMYFFLWILFVFFVSYMYPIITRNMNSILRTSIYGLLCYSSIMFARGSIYGSFTLLIYMTVLFIIITMIFNKKNYAL